MRRPYERGPYGDGPGGRDSREGGRPPERGVPDGLLVGVLGFLLGLTALAWTATGLSALLAHGAWPEGVAFVRTPLAMRELVTEPHDLTAAWPDTPQGQLPGYGLFWGIFLSQLLVLVVLTVFVLGTFTRWRAVRASAAREAREAREAGGSAGKGPGTGVPSQAPPGTPGTAAPVVAQPVPRQPVSAPQPEPADLPPYDSPPAVEQPATEASAVAPAAGAHRPATAPGGTAASRTGLRFGAGAEAAAEAVGDAEGAVLVVTGDPALHTATAGARTKLGPVHVYDPAQLTGAPVRLRWAPHQGCEDMPTARTRAAALLAPVRSPARSESAVHDAAETLLRCWLHAAALTGDPFRQVHRWAQSGSSKEAVRVLRTDTDAAAGAAGELEATLTAHAERREAATALVRRAFGALSQLHIRNACTTSRADRIAWASFVPEGGTLYVVGDSVEAPHRGDPAVMPLVTALTSAVVEHGRRMAERSSAGRLDPPLTVVLDHPATVAPLPELPALLADGETAGLVTVALLRSEEQSRTWWPELLRS